MKKNLLKGLAVAALAMIAGYNVYQAHSETEGMSELMLANVEALAQSESTEPCEKVCYKCDGWMCTRIYNGETSRCIHYRKIR